MTRLRLFCAGTAMGVVAIASTASALEDLKFRVTNADEALVTSIENASLLNTALRDERTAPEDVMPTAIAEYRRLTEQLYSQGYYGGVINILVDGREAADISPLRPPSNIKVIEVVIDAGPQYRFGLAKVAPLAPETELPEGFVADAPALAPLVGRAANEGVSSWRDAGHAKAEIVSEKVSANHPNKTISADIELVPGPRVRFGRLEVTTESAVRAAAIRRIADLPVGEVFSPEELRDANERLLRTEAFASVNLVEGDIVGDELQMEAQVEDRKPRRIGFGAELSSVDGATISGYWLHRNIAGGAERLRFDAEARNIGSTESGVDYELSARLDVPAAVGGDTHAFAFTELLIEDEPTYLSERFELGIGLSRIFSERLEAEIAVSFLIAETEGDLGTNYFELLTFPFTLTYDQREPILDPRSGYYIKAEATPYAGFNGSESGGRIFSDMRAYQGLGERNTLAARLQLGSIVGSDIDETLPEYLFNSGGGGTVRGQPYESLNVDRGDGNRSGGRSFVGVSAEWRADITDSIGVVAFADAGYVGADSWYDEDLGNWHSGAGLGVRYNTGIGPLRFDVGFPTSGETGDGMQIYIGIGQAF